MNSCRVAQACLGSVGQGTNVMNPSHVQTTPNAQPAATVTSSAYLPAAQAHESCKTDEDCGRGELPEPLGSSTPSTGRGQGLRSERMSRITCAGRARGARYHRAVARTFLPVWRLTGTIDQSIDLHIRVPIV